MVYNVYMNKTIKQKLENLTMQPGVYIMKDVNSNIIYIGKAKALKNRISQYFRGKKGKNNKTLALVEKINDFDYIVTKSELDALILENNLIKMHQPHYNILLKDGKNYPYIKINLKDDFPKLDIVRKVKNDGAKYFGPYFAGVSVKEILKIVNYAFKTRTCSLNLNGGKRIERECLNYSLGLCSAPCTGRISKEDYRKIIEDVMVFLKGDNKNVKEILTKKMNEAVEKQQFELAIILRDRLEVLSRLKEKYLTVLTNHSDMDVVGFYSDGINSSVAVTIIRGGKMLGCDTYSMINAAEEKEELVEGFLTQYYKNATLPSEVVLPFDLKNNEILKEYLMGYSKTKINITVPQKGKKRELIKTTTENARQALIKNVDSQKIKQDRTLGAVVSLKEKLGLKSMPYRIECYDISNISGTNSVASMVVFINGEKAKQHYRKFKIKTVEGPNDFASLKEVMIRRFSKLKSDDISFSSQPNLILIDGGKGQLSGCYDAMLEMGGTSEMISIAKKEEEVFLPGRSEPIVLSKTSYALQLLQRLRDEAHRFAITYHRNIRDKSSIRSVLEKIEGVGPTIRKNLLIRFKTIKSIKNASLEELTEVKGVSKPLAQKILSGLNA